MTGIEDDMKLQNWLSVLTFDVAKYVAAGGSIAIHWADDGLTLHLMDVQPDTNGIHGRFKKLAEMSPVRQEPTP